jgi:hypothetical protein
MMLTGEQVHPKNALWNDILVGGTATGTATIALQAETGNVFVSGGLSTYDTTVTDGYVEASGLCLGNGTNCITSWSDGSVGTNYWSKIAGVLSPALAEPLAATSAATTVATFTSTGTNAALRAGGATDYLTVDQNGDLTFVDADGAASITGPAGGGLSLISSANQALTLNAAGGDAAGEDLIITANNLSLLATGALSITPDAALTTAIDLTDTDLTNALSIGDNNIIGTTANIDLTHFDVAGSTGNITVSPGQGLDTNAAGEIRLGYTTATTVSLGTTAATTLNIGAGGALTRTLNFGTGTGADTINIGTGNTVADDINLGGLDTSTIDVLGVTRLGDGGSTNYLSVSATGNLTFTW